jgi:hypothetical protein
MRGGINWSVRSVSEARTSVVNRPAFGGREGAEPVVLRRRPWKTSLVQEPTSRNPPAWLAWNGQKVVLGTGEALLGPAAAGGGKRSCL